MRTSVLTCDNLGHRACPYPQFSYGNQDVDQCYYWNIRKEPTFRETTLEPKVLIGGEDSLLLWYSKRKPWSLERSVHPKVCRYMVLEGFTPTNIYP